MELQSATNQLRNLMAIPFSSDTPAADYEAFLAAYASIQQACFSGKGTFTVIQEGHDIVSWLSEVAKDIIVAVIGMDAALDLRNRLSLILNVLLGAICCSWVAVL